MSSVSGSLFRISWTKFAKDEPPDPAIRAYQEEMIQYSFHEVEASKAMMRRFTPKNPLLRWGDAVRMNLTRHEDFQSSCRTLFTSGSSKLYCSDPCRQHASLIRRTAKLLDGLKDDALINVLSSVRYSSRARSPSRSGRGRRH